MKTLFDSFLRDPLVRGVVMALTRPDPTDSLLVEKTKGLLRSGDMQALFNEPAYPGSFDTATEYFTVVSLRDLFRKMKLPNPSARRVAVENFFKCESQCWHSNYTLSRLPDWDPLHRVLHLASREAAKILGKIPRKIAGRHGPGSVFETRAARTTVADKMQIKNPCMTKGADIFMPHWQETAWHRIALDGNTQEVVPQVVFGNRFTTVPKDISKDRGICIEPSFNVFHQLGIGSVMRRKLKVVAGIDLDDGQMLHRQAALLASCTGDLATLDLSNASDTVSLEIVRLILPPDWFDLLSAVRSPYTYMASPEGSRWYKLEKFSSMGNGYTFELETLIFYCLVKAVYQFHNCEDKPLVYGDDIICRSDLADDVVRVLEMVGFSLNVAKSFTNGPFRESCGGDYFWGMDVRPYFLKEFPTEPHHIIGFANGLYRSAKKLGPGHPFGRNLALARIRCLEALPSKIRSCIGPAELGDIVIHDDRWEEFGRVKDSIRSFRCWRPIEPKKVSWNHFSPAVVYACALYGSGDGKRGITPRDNVAGHKLGWVSYS